MNIFRRTPTNFCWLTATIMITLAGTVTTHAFSFETRALSGDIAPQTGGAIYGSLGIPSLNAAGETAFIGYLTGPNVNSSNSTGIFFEAFGPIDHARLVARSGDTVPGTGPGSYGRFTELILNDAGQIAFRADLTGAGVDIFTNGAGIFSEPAGSIGNPGLVARIGDPVPGTNEGMIYTSLSGPVFNAGGQTAFSAGLFETGPGIGKTTQPAILSEAAGSIGHPHIVALAGDPAPGTDVNYAAFGDPVINAFGQTAFLGMVLGPGTGGDNSSGIFSEAAGSIGHPELVARAGDLAPGAGPGVRYGRLEDPVINSAGQTAFRGALAGAGVGINNDSGIFSEAAGMADSPGLIAREGDSAPGFDLGETYHGLGQPVINSAGEIAFDAVLLPDFNDELFNPTNRAIFSESAGSLGNPGLIVRRGDTAPDTGLAFAAVTSPILNDAGQIVFRGTVDGLGVNRSNDSGIWAVDSNGTLHLIIREGQLFDVDDDPAQQDLRTIASYDFATGTAGGRSTSFNDAGQFAIRIIFTDRTSGIFIATIPEPTSWVTLGITGLALRRRRGA